MFSTDERLASFTVASSSASTSAAKKRQSAKAAPSPLQWPHPVTGRSAKTCNIPTPDTLAKYGFYHTPTSDAPDTVSHFLYADLQIAHWQPNDDPLSRLEQALPGNAWSRIFRSQQLACFDDDTNTWTWQTAELLPTSKDMIQARKESFGSQWPYDGKKGWKPTSKKLAEAGFYFTPTDLEPDNAKCVYCEKSLGGWEKSDDPVHEHRRRVPECAFFNCELRKALDEPVAAAEPTEIDDEVEEIPPAVVASKKGGKRAVSAATRKASAKASKGKKSTIAGAMELDQDNAEAPINATTGAATASQVSAHEEPLSETAIEEPAPVKKGGRKTRSVSTKKLAANTQFEEEGAEAAAAAAAIQEDQAAADALEQVVEAEPVVEEPIKTLSKKKSATGLGNGIATQASSSRPTRAASRRATKAINLLSDEGLNRKLRRPDEEDLERRELALSDPDPIPVLTTPNVPVLESVTDPVVSVKPKGSRSKSKKLDQEALAPTQVSTEPQAELDIPIGQDAMHPIEDDTIIEHEDDEKAPEEELPVEEPKRRGGRAAKPGTRCAAAAAAAAKASSAGTRAKKASAKVTAVPCADLDAEERLDPTDAGGPIAFPSMSSEADAAPEHKRSSRTGTAPRKDSQTNFAFSASPSAAISTCKRSSVKSDSTASQVEAEMANTHRDAVDTDSDALSGKLPKTGSQATIRGQSGWSSATAAMSLSTGRTPLWHLPQLATLNLDESQRRMTLGDWLQMKADAAALEMRAEGEAQLEDLENQLRIGRIAIERRLRGRA